MKDKKKVAHGHHNLRHNCGKMAINWCHSSLIWTYAIPKTWAQKKTHTNTHIIAQRWMRNEVVPPRRRCDRQYKKNQTVLRNKTKTEKHQHQQEKARRLEIAARFLTTKI